MFTQGLEIKNYVLYRDALPSLVGAITNCLKLHFFLCCGCRNIIIHFYIPGMITICFHRFLFVAGNNTVAVCLLWIDYLLWFTMKVNKCTVLLCHVKCCQAVIPVFTLVSSSAHQLDYLSELSLGFILKHCSALQRARDWRENRVLYNVSSSTKETPRVQY